MYVMTASTVTVLKPYGMAMMIERTVPMTDAHPFIPHAHGMKRSSSSDIIPGSSSEFIEFIYSESL